jgi:hypothetical protein
MHDHANAHDQLNAWLSQRPWLVAAIFALGGLWIVNDGHALYGSMVIALGLIWPLIARESAD